MKKYLNILNLFLLIFGSVILTSAQKESFKRDFPLFINGRVEVRNFSGRVEVQTIEEDSENRVLLEVESKQSFSEDDLRIDANGKRIILEVVPPNSSRRIDIIIKVPVRTRVKIETLEGEIRLVGNFMEAEAETNTGTIYADVPLDNLNYKFTWTASRPRFISDVDLEEVKEKSAGRFVVGGKINKKEEPDEKALTEKATEPEDNETDPEAQEDKKKKRKKKKSRDKGQIKLDFSTARGIVLLNVAPESVPTNLRERPLTEAAKAIVRSGDVLLMDAIRRASPKYFGEFARTLPPRRETPRLSVSEKRNPGEIAEIKRAIVRVIDINNRAITDLEKEDFILTERGKEKEIISVQATTAPFNLVLLLDVSGSIDNYVDFIRKAARNFIQTVSPQDKIAIVIFNEDVKTLSVFTKDRNMLSDSLDSFDAGGGTAFYDSLGYTLTKIIRPLKGDRTAIVILSDGDDNRSFLPFKSLLGSIQESGALIYPLYVPSELIAASESRDPGETVDPLRSRYMSLSTKANEEGEQLAQVSGGVYYPISRLSELQKAYNDIVAQLRTAYTITYRSNLAEPSGSNGGISPKLKVKVKRDNTFVKLGSVSAVQK